MSRSRNYCFTLNNYTAEELSHLQAIAPECKYLIFGLEVGESGTPHIQGYVEFENTRSLPATKKFISNRAHLETRKGTSKQASDYCKKEGKFQEFGVMSCKGARTDITQAKDLLKAGMHIRQFRDEYPELYSRYRNTFLDYADDYLHKGDRTIRTRGIWIYGPTGTGKSYKASELAEGDCYYKPDDGKWWDSYRGQKTVILDDFRGELLYSQLLKLLDIWPYHVPRRNREPLPFTSELVIITSSLHPSKVYCNLHSDDKIDQLLRRIDLVFLESRKD